MDVITILLFFLYLFGFGFSATFIFKVKEEEDFIERNVMRLAFGFPVFILLGVVLNLFNVPLYWWIFLILSQIVVVYVYFKRKKNDENVKSSFNFKLTKKNLIYFFLLLLIIFNLYMYTTGSLSYEYLEDDDPWTYAREMKYVATEKTLDVDYFRNPNHLDPYPPGFALVYGVLHQTSPEAQWTLKFFNSLIISLGILFFFFMVRRLSKSHSIALASTFVLTMLPSYLSHFIWSHSLIPGLFFILIYTLEGMFENKKYFLLVSVTVAGILLTHNYQAIKLAILATIYLGTRWAYSKKFPKGALIASIFGVFLSLSWWAFKFKAMVAMQTKGGAIAQEAVINAGSSGLFTRALKTLATQFSPTGGSATRAYSFADFFYAQKSNMINAPIGWGVVVSLLLVLVIAWILLKRKEVLKDKNWWLTAVFIWFIFTFLFVNSETFGLPFGFAAFRMWMLLAIPVSILVGHGIILLMNSFRKIKYLVMVVLLITIFMTSGYANYFHNTNPGWPPGGRFTSYEELGGFVWMKQNLPVNSAVFAYSRVNKFVFGVNMFNCEWCDWYRSFKEETVPEKSMDEMHSWLKEHDYDYMLFSARDQFLVKSDYYKDNEEMTEEKISELYNKRVQEAASLTNKFQPAYQANGFILFKII